MNKSVIAHYNKPSKIKKAGYRTGQLIEGKDVARVISAFNKQKLTVVLIPKEKRNVILVGEGNFIKHK